MSLLQLKRPNRTYPFHFFAGLEHQFIFHRIEFADFHLSMCLELLEQNVSTSFIVVETNRTLETNKKVEGNRNNKEMEEIQVHRV